MIEAPEPEQRAAEDAQVGSGRAAVPADYYGLRRLSPYLGVVQVIDVGDACAYSTDGRRWQIRNQNMQGRFRLTGLWSDFAAQPEPVRGGELAAALARRPRLPFPLRDRFELWLLDRASRLPLALLKTRRWPHEIAAVDDPTWQPFMLEDNRFHAPTLARQTAPRQPGVLPCRHRDLLERLVDQAARPHPAAQWFEREPTGAGVGGDGLRIDAELRGRRLPAAAFPALLVREDWPDAVSRALIDDYHAFVAPLLLAHSGLAPAVRARLENAACARPDQVLANYPMYPQVLDSERLKVALVSGKLMRAN